MGLQEGEDEAQFCKTPAAPKQSRLHRRPHQFSCSDAKCIERKYVCDGLWDCKQGEDERSFCPNESLRIPPPTCKMPESSSARTQPVFHLLSSATENGEDEMKANTANLCLYLKRKNLNVEMTSC